MKSLCRIGDGFIFVFSAVIRILMFGPLLTQLARKQPFASANRLDKRAICERCDGRIGMQIRVTRMSAELLHNGGIAMAGRHGV